MVAVATDNSLAHFYWLNSYNRGAEYPHPPTSPVNVFIFGNCIREVTAVQVFTITGHVFDTMGPIMVVGRFTQHHTYPHQAIWHQMPSLMMVHQGD